MNNEQTCFKVAYKESDYYVSVIMTDDMRIVYEIGKTSKAKENLAALGYHLTVFSSMEYARDFKDGINKVPHSCMGLAYILECNCTNVDIPYVPMIIGINSCNFGIDKYNLKFGVWSTGTLMAETVTPIGIVG